MNLKNVLLLTSICLIFFPLFAYAHDDGTAIIQAAGKYEIEFEYGTKGFINAGEPMYYAVHLLDAGTDASAEFDSVYVTMKRHPSVVTEFYGMIRQSSDVAGTASWNTVLTGGEYKVDLIFYQNKKELAKSTFDLSVKYDPIAIPDSGAMKFYRTDWFAALALVGALLVGYGLKSFLGARKP